MPRLNCASHLLGTVAEQDRALAQRSCAALQQGLDLRRVLVAQLATLRLHPPASQPIRPSTIKQHRWHNQAELSSSSDLNLLLVSCSSLANSTDTTR